MGNLRLEQIHGSRTHRRSHQKPIVIALKPGQIIESISGEKLQDIDPRIRLGNFITAAEAAEGTLKFAIKGEANAYKNPGNAEHTGTGLFWFQGIADAASPRMAAEYEKHLNNLIRDLRKDLGKPELPVVIAAIGWDGTHAAKVRDAQLAASDPSNKITTIDTRPFLRPAAGSSASSETTYHANAASYLEIGEAMGKAMLELQKK